MKDDCCGVFSDQLECSALSVAWRGVGYVAAIAVCLRFSRLRAVLRRRSTVIDPPILQNTAALRRSIR